MVTALTVAIFLLSSCSQPSNPAGANVTTVAASEPSNAAEPVTAKTAYGSIYKSAYKWAPDLVLLRLAPKDVPGLASGGGKAGQWEATVASPSKHEYRVFTLRDCRTAAGHNQRSDHRKRRPVEWVTRDVMPIQASEFSVDSDAAYTTAAADAAAWLKKNPDKKLSSFQLGNGYSFPTPVWYAMWGDKKSGYVAIVSASTGKVLKK